MIDKLTKRDRMAAIEIAKQLGYGAKNHNTD